MATVQRDAQMYRAPLKEIRFALRQIAGDDRLSALPGLSAYSTDFADSVLEEAAKFAEQELDPINAVGDSEGAKWTPQGVFMPADFRRAYERFTEAGWTRLRAPADLGGLNAPCVLATAVEELWASSNLAFKLCPMLSRAAVEAISRCGSEAQREQYLPKLVSGEWAGTMNLTEPQAGSDLGAIRTRAIPDGADYRLVGQKIFITYGDHDYTPNIIHLVLARIEGAPAGTRGISLFIVPKILINAEGALGAPNEVRCLSIERKLGIHGSPTCVMSYGETSGALGYLVGEANRGLEYMFIMMNAARLSVGLEGYALAERAYQKARTWASERVQGRPAGAISASGNGSLPISYHPDVKRMLLTMKAYTDAARALALYGALQLDLGEYETDVAARDRARARGDLLIPIIKAWSTEQGVAVTSLGVQVHGGMGFIEDTGAAQLFRDARITTIYEGTTGIQANDLVGRKVSRDAGAAMYEFIEFMREDIAALSTQTSNAGEDKSALAALNLLQEATEDILRLSQHGIEHAQAVAVPYLMLCGAVMGGWIMVKSSDFAHRHEADDRSFYTAKQQVSRFYLQHILSSALALADTVKHGSSSVSDAAPALL